MTTPVPCYHCALPVPSGSRFTAIVLGEAREFCCPGCQAVAHAIVAGGLESYYQHRSEASANPDALPVQLLEELALYDRADVQKPFVRHDGEQAETTLLIEGISCAACGWLIEKTPASFACRQRGAAQSVQSPPARALGRQPIAPQ